MSPCWSRTSFFRSCSLFSQAYRHTGSIRPGALFIFLGDNKIMFFQWRNFQIFSFVFFLLFASDLIRWQFNFLLLFYPPGTIIPYRKYFDRPPCFRSSSTKMRLPTLAPRGLKFVTTRVVNRDRVENFVSNWRWNFWGIFLCTYKHANTLIGLTGRRKEIGCEEIYIEWHFMWNLYQ